MKEPTLVWVLTEFQSGQLNVLGVYWEKAEVYREMRETVMEYENHSAVADEVPHVLEELAEAYESKEYKVQFGAGDGGCIFYVEATLCEVK